MCFVVEEIENAFYFRILLPNSPRVFDCFYLRKGALDRTSLICSFARLPACPIALVQSLRLLSALPRVAAPSV